MLRFLIFTAYILTVAATVHASNDCLHLEKIAERSTENKSTAFITGYLGGANTKYTNLYGPFQHKLKTILRKKNNLDITNANYSMITSNLLSFISAYPEQIYKLKAALLYCKVVSVLPEAQEFSYKYDTPEKINYLLTSWAVDNWHQAHDGTYIILYAGFLTEMMLGGQEVSLAAKKQGFVIDYYPSEKKELISAIISSNFDKMNKIINDSHISKIAQSIVAQCVQR